jgi:hypothetical protein
LSEDCSIKEAQYPCDLYYSRIVLVPGTKELLVIGGSKDVDSEITSNQVIQIKGKDELNLKKPLTVSRSKISLAVAKT